MENQTQKIKGYRNLSPAEIDLINDIKAKEVELMDLAERVAQHLKAQEIAAIDAGDEDEGARIDAAQPKRWFAMAVTDFQVGMMKLTRAVGQPMR